MTVERPDRAASRHGGAAGGPLPTICAVRDFDGYTLSIDPGYEAELGWTLDELASVPFWELLHPDDQHRSVEVHQRMLLSGPGRMRGHPVRMLRRDGTYRPTRWDLRSATDEERVYLVAVMDPAPEPSPAEDRVLVGSWDWNLRTDTMTWSERMAGIWGVAPVAPCGVAQALLRVHPGDRAAVARAMRDSITSGDPYVVDHRIVRGDGALRWLHSAGRVFRGTDGDPERLRGLTFDVTGRTRNPIPG